MDNQPTAAAGPDVYPYLQKLYSLGGSDMFFSVGTQPQLKVEGLTHPVGSEVMKPGAVQHMAYQLMTQKQVAEFERDLEMNLAVSLQGAGRYRVNVYYQRGEVSMVVRLIKSQIPNIESLGLPPQLEKLSLLDRGLILVKGSVPGVKGAWVSVRDAVKRKLPESAPKPGAFKLPEAAAAPAAE